MNQVFVVIILCTGDVGYCIVLGSPIKESLGCWYSAGVVGSSPGKVDLEFLLGLAVEGFQVVGAQWEHEGAVNWVLGSNLGKQEKMGRSAFRQ